MYEGTVRVLGMTNATAPADLLDMTVVAWTKAASTKEGAVALLASVGIVLPAEPKEQWEAARRVYLGARCSRLLVSTSNSPRTLARLSAERQADWERHHRIEQTALGIAGLCCAVD